MRVVGEQGLAARAPAPVDDPIVRGPARTWRRDLNRHLHLGKAVERAKRGQGLRQVWNEGLKHVRSLRLDERGVDDLAKALPES